MKNKNKDTPLKILKTKKTYNSQIKKKNISGLLFHPLKKKKFCQTLVHI